MENIGNLTDAERIQQVLEELANAKEENDKLKEVISNLRGNDTTPSNENIEHNDSNVLGVRTRLLKNISKIRSIQKEDKIEINHNNLMETKKEPELYSIDTHIKEKMIPKNEVVYKIDKFSEFKNMIANYFVNVSNKYAFINKPDWKNLKSKVEISIDITKIEAKDYFENIIKSFTNIAAGSGIMLKNIKNGSSNIQDTYQNVKERILLIGNKKVINKLQKDFTATLNMLGFEAHELYHETKKTNFITKDEVKIKLDEELKELQFINQDGKYINEFISNLDDDSKARTIYSALWPSLAKKIQEGMQLTTAISQFMGNNKYLLMIGEFAKKNDMNPEDVTNILEVDPKAFEDKHLLHKKIGGELIKKNYTKIVENIHKFSILASNNHSVMESLVKATEDLKATIDILNIAQNRKEELINAIDSTNVYKDKQGHVYKYSTIRKNIGTIIENNSKNSGIGIVERQNNIETIEIVQQPVENEITSPLISTSLKM